MKKIIVALTLSTLSCFGSTKVKDIECIMMSVRPTEDKIRCVDSNYRENEKGETVGTMVCSIATKLLLKSGVSVIEDFKEQETSPRHLFRGLNIGSDGEDKVREKVARKVALLGMVPLCSSNLSSEELLGQVE